MPTPMADTLATSPSTFIDQPLSPCRAASSAGRTMPTSPRITEKVTAASPPSETMVIMSRLMQRTASSLKTRV